MRVGLVTCVNLPEPDPDQDLLLNALRARGLQPALLAWDDPRACVADFDVCVLRSCWNYYEAPTAFQAWVNQAGQDTSLWNPPTVVQWNLNKRYLINLQEAGVPVVPTAWVPRGETGDFLRLLADNDWQDVVIKPAISAGSWRTRRFHREDANAAQVFLDAVSRDCDAMVQRYEPSVEQDGERVFVWIDGSFSHSVRKAPRFADGEERIEGARTPNEDERAFAQRVLGLVHGDLLYARVDTMQDAAGRVMVSELELIEPSLFFLEWPPALERFVAAIAARVG